MAIPYYIFFLTDVETISWKVMYAFTLYGIIVIQPVFISDFKIDGLLPGRYW